jgi:hypothetical protein
MSPSRSCLWRLWRRLRVRRSGFCGRVGGRWPVTTAQTRGPRRETGRAGLRGRLASRAVTDKAKLGQDDDEAGFVFFALLTGLMFDESLLNEKCIYFWLISCHFGSFSRRRSNRRIGRGFC